MKIEQALQNTLGFGVKDFIEKAIEGGWKKNCKGWHIWANQVTHTGTNGFNEQSLTFEQILLDPKAWKAVGRTEGWMYKLGERNTLHHEFIDELYKLDKEV